MSKLKQLQQQWAKKLRASGFKDIERPDGRLRDYHSRSFSQYVPEELEERQKYFTLAVELGKGYNDEYGNFIDVFAGNEDARKIWLAYAEGYDQQAVALRCKCSPSTVSRVIAKYNKYIVR